MISVVCRVYLAVRRAGAGLTKPEAESLGPGLARPSGLDFRPKHGPSEEKPIRPQVKPLP